jgi:acyl carrier protein
MPVRDIIAAIFAEVAAEQEVRLPELTDDAAMLDLDLDSLCLAIIVARLEARLGRDPFSEADEVAFPVTFGDFVAMYENAV